MFTHLHLHSEYSLLDGACRIEQLLDLAKARGDTAVAITDHGVLYGAVLFYKAALARGLQPILGCEVYVAQRTRHDRTHGLDSQPYHLVLLCENNVGYQNLIQLVSRAWTEGFYSKPRVDWKLLEQYHEGLIALSACLAGEVPRQLSAGNYEAAKAAALRYDALFGRENYYLELQDHGLPEQRRVNSGLIRLSQDTGIPLVLTNDCHYLTREDSEMHRVLLCIQTASTLEDEGGLSFGSREYYYKSEQEMRALFPEQPQAADNTARIASRCHVTLEFGKTKIPRFDPPGGQDSYGYFRDKCFAGLHEKYGANPGAEIVQRLEYELDTIRQMGYVNYYLIVWDFVRHAKEAGIPVGPGRGSGAGSLAAYCIGITGIDPIRYDLLFERFLNPERVSMPDFDIDFADDRRSEMIDYVVEKYGADHVAQIVTFGTMAARASIRDVGRVMGMPYAAVDAVAKLVPRELNITLQQALEKAPELRARCENDPQVRALVDMARKLEGMPRNASTHAAGVVITDKPVADYVPLAMNGDAVVCQYTMTVLEELGLLKMDFLGLRNLTIIDDAEKMIRKQEPAFSIQKIPLDAPQVYAMLARGEVVGVFQYESPGMRRTIMQLVPEGLEDLIAVISLFRPGPMKSIPRYIENRHHPAQVRYRHPLLEPILRVTYGCIVYQEQVMQIFRSLAGYGFGRADVVRRAMAKKKHGVMEREKEVFVHGEVAADGTVLVPGCLRNGVDERTALDIFAEMEDFASYAFNKSHAAAYALVAYQTAYLKYFYPQEYMAALLTSVLDNSDKLAGYIAECGRLHIRVLPPHVNSSAAGFTPQGKDIRFGLLAVHNLGRGLIDAIVRGRSAGGPYKGLYDLCSRLYDSQPGGNRLNRRALESLIRSGAMDGLDGNRRELLFSAPLALEALEEDRRRNVDGQLGLFGGQEAQSAFTLQHAQEYSQADLLAMEKEVTGVYLSGHPLEAYRAQYRQAGAASIGAILHDLREEGGRWHDGDSVRLLGIVTAVRTKLTKRNETMAFVTLEDFYGAMQVLLFPNTLARCAQLVAVGQVLLVAGHLSARDEQDPELLCDSVQSADNLPQAQPRPAPRPTAARHSPPGLYLKVQGQQDPAWLRAQKYLAVFDGEVPLYVAFVQEKQLFRAPRAMAVDPQPSLLRALRGLLGAQNVALVQPGR